MCICITRLYVNPVIGLEPRCALNTQIEKSVCEKCVSRGAGLARYGSDDDPAIWTVVGIASDAEECKCTNMF